VRWDGLEVVEIAWLGWVLHRIGDVLGWVARVTSDDACTIPAGDLAAVDRRRLADRRALAMVAQVCQGV